LRQRPQYRDMRRYIAYATRALRSLPRRITYIMVRRIPCEGQRDSSSENGQTGAVKAVPNLSHAPDSKGSMRRAGGKPARRRMVYSGLKKRKLAGRLLGAVSKARTINRDAGQSIFSFTSQPQSTRGASETLKVTQLSQLIEHSQIDCDII
jgi:hypothetical protein